MPSYDSEPLPLASQPSSSSSSSLGRAPLLLPSFLQSLPEGSAHTLSELAALEDEAREILPGSIDQCSYPQTVRQSVYACKTCESGQDGQRGGMCFACSVSCHGDHELIELFPKRAFQCDCPTTRLPNHPCALLPPGASTVKLPPSATNRYDHNFAGRFCVCDADYDPQEEAEDMMQCLVCEDWFHSSHLNLTSPSGPPATTTTPAPPSSTNGALPPAATTSADIPATAESSVEDDTEGPPPVLTEDDYAHIVCERCVLTHPVLVDHLGSAGFMTIVKPPIDAPMVEWDVLGRVDATPGSVNEGPASAEGPAPDGAANPRKHPLTPRADSPSAAEDPPAKKVKLSNSEETTPSAHSTCTLALHLPHLAALVASRQAAVSPDHGFSSGRADLFLPEDFRERWCRCEKHLPQLKALPYLLEEEETWEPAEEAPPPDADMDALLMSSLSSLSHTQQINTITGFKDLSAGLSRYLNRVASEGEGRVIGKRDIDEFFEKWKKGERF